MGNGQSKRELEAARQREEEIIAEIDRRRKAVNEWVPGKSHRFKTEHVNFPKRLNIGLFGATAVGKTSLMNSITYAVNGQFDFTQWLQTAPPGMQGGHTMKRKRHQVTSSLLFYDNRGISSEDLGSEGTTKEMIAQLEGRSRLSQNVDWRTGEDYSPSAHAEDMMIDCTVLVYDARSAIQDDACNRTKGFTKFLFEWQGYYPIGVITHIDQPGSGSLKNARAILQAMGITDIFEVKNLHHDYKVLEKKYELELLRMIDRCLYQGEEIIILREETKQGI